MPREPLPQPEHLRVQVRSLAFPPGWLDSRSDNQLAARSTDLALRLVDEIEELQLALANERGEGPPPFPGWRFDGCLWMSPTMCVALCGFGRWEWARRRMAVPSVLGFETTARSAMRAAHEAGLAMEVS